MEDVKCKSVACPACSGTGRIPRCPPWPEKLDPNRPCNACSGTGRLVHPRIYRDPAGNTFIADRHDPKKLERTRLLDRP